MKINKNNVLLSLVLLMSVRGDGLTGDKSFVSSSIPTQTKLIEADFKNNDEVKKFIQAHKIALEITKAIKAEEVIDRAQNKDYAESRFNQIDQKTLKSLIEIQLNDAIEMMKFLLSEKSIKKNLHRMPKSDDPYLQEITRKEEHLKRNIQVINDYLEKFYKIQWVKHIKDIAKHMNSTPNIDGAELMHKYFAYLTTLSYLTEKANGDDIAFSHAPEDSFDIRFDGNYDRSQQFFLNEILFNNATGKEAAEKYFNKVLLKKADEDQGKLEHVKQVYNFIQKNYNQDDPSVG